jgi:dUTP pyrophosphatase
MAKKGVDKGEPLNIKCKIGQNGTIPTYATDGSACFDIYSAEYYCFDSGMTVTVSTELFVEVPKGYMMQIVSRSGMSCDGLVVANAPGIIDSDYRGEVKIILHNQGKYANHVRKGQRIAQGYLVPVIYCYFDVVDKLNETERGAGGFGSTGK